eukprot:SAG22_NODE_215_length_14950_cov_4.960676_3_plen_615_part_00
MEGRSLPSQWFTWAPTDALTYEVRLMTRDSEATFELSSNLYDEDGDRIFNYFEPPQMYRQKYGAMLRWNITQSQSGRQVPHYMYAASSVEYSLTVVTPPVYVYEIAVDELVDDHIDFMALEIARPGEATIVQLSFKYPLFGVLHSKAWISSAGWVSFEQPVEMGVFVGMAVVACGAEFTSRSSVLLDSGPVTVAALESELRVRWVGALFNSSDESDVTLSLRPDGSATISWDQIHLGPGGSLRHGMVCRLVAPGNSSIDTDRLITAVPDASGHNTGVTVVQNERLWSSVDVVAVDATRYFDSSATIWHHKLNSSIEDGVQVTTTTPATFEVRDGPCTLESSGRCVGRPKGYGPSESCKISVSGQATIRCPLFDVELDYDGVSIDSRPFYTCPQGVDVSSSSNIFWNSDGGLEGRGWQICAEDSVLRPTINEAVPDDTNRSMTCNSDDNALIFSWFGVECAVMVAKTPTCDYDLAAFLGKSADGIPSGRGAGVPRGTLLRAICPLSCGCDACGDPICKSSRLQPDAEPVNVQADGQCVVQGSCVGMYIGGQFPPPCSIQVDAPAVIYCNMFHMSGWSGSTDGVIEGLVIDGKQFNGAGAPPGGGCPEGLHVAPTS